MASQNENGVFGEILERVYRAATGESQWESVLTTISEVTNSSYAFFQEHNSSTKEITRFLHDAAPLEILDDWVSYWYGVDPRFRFAQKHPTEDIYNDYKIMEGEDAINKDVFYNEFLSLLGVRYHAASSILSPSGVNGASRVAYLGFNKRQSAGHATPQECELLINLRPHFERALAIEARLGVAVSQSQILSDALNALAYGVAIVNGAASIRWANEQAKQILASRDGIVSEKGTLAPTTAAARNQLENLVANARATLADPRRQPGGALLIPRQLASPIEVLVAPLPSNSALIADLVSDPRNCAVCFLYERGQPKLTSETALIALFGLTRSEASLAIELANGATLKDAADTRGITYETARTQLKTIYSKTDTHSQAQLVSAVLKSPAALLKGHR
jgi:DNA-binding CsgD family transcriptional regulator